MQGRTLFGSRLESAFRNLPILKFLIFIICMIMVVKIHFIDIPLIEKYRIILV